MPWRLRGEFVVSCNCDFFCPCMPSLGKARPTHGACHSWFGYHLADGRIDDVTVADLNVVMMLEVPGKMEEGNWTEAFYFDERSTPAEREGLGRILGGREGGPIGWTSLMVAQVLEPRVVPIRFTRAEREWGFEISRVLDGTVEAAPGAGGDGLIRLTNTRYWMAPDVVLALGKRSRFRDHGRNWDLSAKSAEYGHHVEMISVVGAGLTLPFDVEPYPPGDCEYVAGQRLLQRAVAQVGRRFADYVVVDGEFATAPFLHVADDLGGAGRRAPEGEPAGLIRGGAEPLRGPAAHADVRGAWRAHRAVGCRGLRPVGGAALADGAGAPPSAAPAQWAGGRSVLAHELVAPARE